MDKEKNLLFGLQDEMKRKVICELWSKKRIYDHRGRRKTLRITQKEINNGISNKIKTLLDDMLKI